MSMRFAGAPGIRYGGVGDLRKPWILSFQGGERETLPRCSFVIVVLVVVAVVELEKT